MHTKASAVDAWQATNETQSDYTRGLPGDTSNNYPASAVISLEARPGLLNQKRQVVYPIVLAYAARINDMGQVIFGVRHNKIGVGNRIIAVVGLRFLG